jgi:uncharacterized membrane protein
VNGSDEEFQRAAVGYFVWPLAAFDLLRESQLTSRWARIHTRQALVYGLGIMLGYLVLLAIPLVLSIVLPNLPTVAIVAIYGAGLLADLLIALIVLAATIRYSGMASRGEVFEIPIASRFAQRIFPMSG